MIRLLTAVLLALLSACLSRAEADSVPEQNDAVVLSVSGMITAPDGDGEITFDMGALERLPSHVVRTENPWVTTPTTYEGILLRDLLKAVGSSGSTMTIHALDDYHEDISVEDARLIDVILAYKRDGTYVPVRRKGPLLIIFPFSDHPELLTHARREQSVWQVNKIVIK